MGTSSVRAVITEMRAAAAESSALSTGLDLRMARVMGGAFWLTGGVAAAVLLPVAPPTKQLGQPGWLVAATLIAGGVILAYRRLDEGRPSSLREILLAGYFGLGAICLLEWLAGGRDTAYHYLYMLPVLFAAGAHGRRQVLTFFATISIVIWAPLAYGPVNRQVVSDIGIQLIMLLAVGAAVSVLFIMMRAQRTAIRKARKRAELLARRDQLTGLGNRRAFEEALSAEVARARRTETHLSVIIGDLDRFKEVNDRFGHAAGDRCLRQVAAVLTEILRIEDACFRWGGDEFAVLLANSDRPDAERLAARVRARVAELCVIDGEVEVGITCATAELAASQSASEFIAIADELLLALTGDPTRRPRARLGGPVSAGRSE